MSRYELVARGGMPEEDDSNYIVQIAQDRLKRKKFKRMLIASICVVVFFFIAAGIAVGVVLGVTSNSDQTKHTETTNAPIKNLVQVSTAVIDSLPPSVLQTTSQGVITPTTSVLQTTSLGVVTPTTLASKDDSKTFTTTHIHSARSYTSVVVSTTLPSISISPQAATTRKATSTVTSHRPQPTTASQKTSITNQNIKSTAAAAVISTMITTSPKHTLNAHHHSGYKVTTSTRNQIHITTSRQHASMTLQTTTSVSPSPTVIPVNTVNSRILNYIDTWYDPCENFYEYSCGRWHNSHPDASEWGTFHDLALDNYNRIAEYLSRYASSRDSEAITKAKFIYGSCIDSDSISRNLIPQLKSFMVNKAGGWENGDFLPSHSWSINSNLYKDHYLGSSAFFTFGVEPDDLNSSKPVIRVSS